MVTRGRRSQNPASASLIKEINKALVLRAFVLNHDSTKSEIVRQTGLSFPTVSKIIAELETEGLIRAVDTLDSTGGRPANLYKFNPQAAVLVAVDIGHSRLTLCAFDLAHNELYRQDISFKASPPTPSQLIRTLDHFLAECPTRPQRIAISVPGIIDHETGIVQRSLILGWGRTPLRELVMRAFDLHTIVENDAVAAAAGEWHFGYHRGIGETMVYLAIGRGIGAGVVVNGEILRGAHNRLGAIGHTTISFDSPVKCRCGNPGCLEAFVGYQAILQMGRERGIVTAQHESEAISELLTAVNTRKPEAVELLAEIARYLAVGIHNLIQTLDPAVVIIGSDLAQHSVFIESVQSNLASLNPTFASFVDIRASSLYPDASLRGAYAIAFQDFIGATPQPLVTHMS